ncbi:hypothetical protein PND93_01965 [Faecalicoccus pleomorphus]|uniref:hypothetical protein n=1 Tax=Faecalicoccus pleomorphus TaxID=1323 RepID=UPI00232F9961|nr:hypothetical protein [Faecalicoccus pleomorphus]MDB7986205.1 hypothetical protein [Faecalicoccus pleomorphus]MDB7990347.1 hypothetical protein [Faecalicoccus pleomorphus]
MEDQFNKEIQEAIQAANHALACLRQADAYLQSAKNWGLFDMLGGGALTTFFKHSKMDDARYEMERAKRALQGFRKELADVDQRLHLSLEIGDFLTFADYFFDGLIADWLVQSKIQDAKAQVENAIIQVRQIREDLLRYR